MQTVIKVVTGVENVHLLDFQMASTDMQNPTGNKIFLLMALKIKPKKLSSVISE